MNTTDILAAVKRALQKTGIAVTDETFSENFIVANSTKIFIEIRQLTSIMPENKIREMLLAVSKAITDDRMVMIDFEGRDMYLLSKEPEASRDFPVLIARIQSICYEKPAS